MAKQSAYTPFGKATDWTNATFPTGETKGFLGERYDADAGLSYLNARYYDPVLGIFIQPDWFEVMDAGVGTNRYGYSGNDPVNNFDPYGNAWYNNRDDFKDSWNENFGSSTTTYADGTVEYRSGRVLRTVVPGQVFNDNAVSAGMNGDYVEAAIHTVGMLGEVTLTGLTLGTGGVALQAEKAAAREASIFAEKGLLKSQSLSNEATRKWYLEQLKTIQSKINSNLPLREQTLQAFKLRNEIKMQARSLMADQTAAKSLPAPKTLQEVVRTAYRQGRRGDDVWNYVLGGSQRSNANVDAILGLTKP